MFRQGFDFLPCRYHRATKRGNLCRRDPDPAENGDEVELKVLSLTYILMGPVSLTCCHLQVSWKDLGGACEELIEYEARESRVFVWASLVVAQVHLI